MPLKFNPFTGTLDRVNAPSGSGDTFNTNNYSSINAPQLFNPDAGGVSGNTDDFTLASSNAVALVTHNGQVLDDSEYSLAGSTLTVTPDNGFTDTSDEVLVYQHSFDVSGSGQTLNYVQKTASYTVTSGDYHVDLTANDATFTLPTAVGIGGQSFVLINSGTGTLTLDGNGSETINGEASIDITQYESIRVTSNGANWIITEA